MIAPPRPRPLDRRALGRQLSRVANASVAEVLAVARTESAPAARRIGLTGPPEVDKSSLGGRIAVQRAQRGRVGVLAIDPSSPFSGGAILGDRIRMDELESVNDLFVRSLHARWTTGSPTICPSFSRRWTSTASTRSYWKRWARARASTRSAAKSIRSSWS